MRFLNLALLLFVISSHAGELRVDYKKIEPGLDYAHIVISNQPWSIYVARLDQSRKELGLITTLAKGRVEGLSTVAKQTASLNEAAGIPIAAVNGDFFVIKSGPYQGDPLGLHILSGEIISTPVKASFWMERRRPHAEVVQSMFQVRWPDGKNSPAGLNEDPGKLDTVLFTPTFGSSTKATNFAEVVLQRDGKKDWLPLRPNQRYQGRVKAINFQGNTTLGPDDVVVTVNSKATNHLANVGPGSLIKFSTQLSSDLSHATMAIGGRPILLANGKIQVHEPAVVAGKTNSLAVRNPRTAIGYNRRSIFLVEVDGRQPQLSVGMNFEELAALMKDLGCTDAMNLDGGGSSTFWLEGKIMNSPSDKHERSVANALVVVKTVGR